MVPAAVSPKVGRRMLQNLPKRRCSLMNPGLALNRPWRPYMLSLSLVSQFPLGHKTALSLLRPGERLLCQLRTGGLLLCLLCRRGLLPCLIYTGGLLLRHGGLLPRLLRPGGLRSRLLRPGGLLSSLLHSGGLLSHLPSPGGLRSRLFSPGGLWSCLLRLGTLLCRLCLSSWSRHFHMDLALRPSPSSTSAPPHGLLHYTHCCTPPQTTIPITHCTDDTRTEHTADCTEHTTYLNHGLPLPLGRVLFSI